MGVIKIEDVQNKIVEIQGQKVLLDSDVAELYAVETKRINEAVRNNPNKFPSGYIIELSKNEWDLLKSKFSTSKRGGKVKIPKAFPEKATGILFETLEKESQRIQYSLSLSIKRIKRFEKNMMFHQKNFLLNGVQKI